MVFILKSFEILENLDYISKKEDQYVDQLSLIATVCVLSLNELKSDQKFKRNK